MTGSETFADSHEPLDVEYYQYRSVCSAAILAIVLAGLSLASVLASALLLLPALGIILSLMAIADIRKSPNELTGMGLAKAALFLNSFILIGVVSFNVWVYLTEVPEGYQRISFSQLQPERNAKEPIPSTAKDLNGQKVFIKGYTYPGERRRNLKRFVLVPDLGSCCFGGQPALTDMIEVTLDDPLTANYGMRCRKLTGVFEVDTTLKPVTGLGGVYYRLKADGIK
ncbi:MAG: DUF3299 domain-containing protein [Planctomycetota bacterium]